MYRFVLKLVAAGAALALFAAGPGVADLTGSWHLNVAKSRWGKVRKPLSIVVEITHAEPALRYAGTVTYQQEDARDFSFDGVIDGKEYPAVRSYGEGKITVNRTGPTTLTSVFKSNDGQFIENATTTVSGDGKVMTRKLSLVSPEQRASWTEVYERR